MEYLHHSSLPATKSELELFSIPPTQTAIDSSYEVHYRPTSTLDSSKSYDFLVPPSDDFTDLSATYIYLRAKVLKSDGSEASPIKYFGSALFDQVDFYIGNVSITPASNLYHYQSFFENLLFRQPNPIDAASTITDDDGERITGGKEFDLYFRLHSSMCQQNNLLISNTPLTFRFTRSKDNFCFKGNGKLEIKISEIFLVIRRVKVFPDVAAGIMLAIDKAPAKYFVTRNEVKSFSIGQGLNSSTIENVFSGTLPKRMVIGFVSNKSFGGDLEADPFEFSHFNISHLSSYVDGNQIPSVAYSPDFKNDIFMREFVSLYRYMNQDEGIPQLDLTYSKYKKCVLFAFDYTADGSVGSESGTLSLVKRGNIRIEFKFNGSLAAPIHMVVFAQFDNLIQIDKYRNVTLDY